MYMRLFISLPRYSDPSLLPIPRPSSSPLHHLASSLSLSLPRSRRRRRRRRPLLRAVFHPGEGNNV